MQITKYVFANIVFPVLAGWLVINLATFENNVVAFLITVITTALLGDFVLFIYPKFTKRASSPHSKNISLSCLPLSNNEIRFKVKNLEFRKKQVIVSKLLVGLNSQERWISVIENVSILKFLKSVEFPFIKLYPKENMFEVVYPNSESPEKFGSGVHKFDVAINYGYNTPREGLLSRYVVVVEFSGGVLKIASLSTPAT